MMEQKISKREKSLEFTFIDIQKAYLMSKILMRKFIELPEDDQQNGNCTDILIKM